MLPPLEYEYVTSAERLGHIANEISDAKIIAIDLETTGLNPVTGAKIRLCSVNTGRGVYVIDVFKTGTLGPVARALNESTCVKIGHNLKFDQKFLLYYYDIELWPVYDSFRASQLMWNGRRVPHDLWSVQLRDINEKHRTQDLGGSDWTLPELTKDQKDYAADDVIALPLLREAQKTKLVTLGLNRVALIEFGSILPESAVELNGLFLNEESWLKLAADNEKQQNSFREHLYRELDDPSNQFALPGMRNDWNLDSPVQMLESLRRKGLKIEDTKEMTLAMLSTKYPIIDKILSYREYAHSVKTYGKSYIAFINPDTHRIHPEYFGFLAAGRFACRNPNLSAIPRNKLFRSCFQAEEGFVYVLADYSGIEMRIVAEEANDPTLMKVFQQDKDIHKETASFLLGIPYEQITKAQKQQAKPVNFGFCIAEGQRVLTDMGLIPIEDVTCWHKVWDGVDWVSHDGLLYKGIKDVVTYDGLTATPDHEVFTADGNKIPLAEALENTRRLAIGGVEGVPARYDAFDRQAGETSTQPSVRRGNLWGLFQDTLDSSGQREGKEDYQLRLPGEIQRLSIRVLRDSVRRYGSTLLSRLARLVTPVQGKRDPGALQVAGALYSLGPSEMAYGILRWNGPGSEGQQRALLSGESSISNSNHKSPQPRVRRSRVYDILNAGPRHRFTVEGRVVSNCYGMMPQKMVLYAKANYKVDMSLRQATEFREKYMQYYSAIPRWHDRALRDGKRMKVVYTRAGRLRWLEEDAHNEIFNCLDAETEALTARGWVKGFDLKKDTDILLTKNIETGNLEWQGMTDLKLWPNYKGKLVEFKSKSFSAVSTPSHRWLVTNKRTGKTEEKTTAKLSIHGDHRIHRTGTYLGHETPVFTDDFVELCGWFLTDGNFTSLPRKRSVSKPSVSLYQSSRANAHKVARIDNLLKRLQIKHRRYEYQKHNHIVTWRLNADISKQLHNLFPSRILVPEFLRCLTASQTHRLLDTMVLGDGWRETSGRTAFCSKSSESTDLFQMLCVLCGFSSSQTKRNMAKYKPLSPKMKNVPVMGNINVVNILKRDKVQVLKKQRREFDGEQPVWCPMVPNTFFVARRLGHVFVTGNTPVQGLGADGLKAALRLVYFRIKNLIGYAPVRTLSRPNPDSKMVHHVHDEIITENKKIAGLPEAIQKELEQGMEEGMSQFLQKVPVKAEGAIGETWADKS